MGPCRLGERVSVSWSFAEPVYVLYGSWNVIALWLASPRRIAVLHPLDIAPSLQILAKSHPMMYAACNRCVWEEGLILVARDGVVAGRYQPM